MARKHHTSKVEIVRRLILGAIAAILVLVLGYSLLYVLGVVGSGNTEPYFTLENRELETEPIEVIEFFSYACPHCARLEPLLKTWARDLPDDISYRKVHVAISAQTRILARVHVALDQRGLVPQNSKRIFAEAERRPRTFNSIESISQFVDGHGIDADLFQRLYESNRVENVLNQNAQLARELRIERVPVLVVANRYVIPPKTLPRDTISTLREVIQKIRTGELSMDDTSPSEDASADESPVDPADDALNEETEDQPNESE